MATRKRSNEIRDFVLDLTVDNGLGIARRIAERFGITRQAANVHLRKLVEEGLLVSSGETQDRNYRLSSLESAELVLKIEPGIEEDVLWTRVAREVAPLPENVRSIAFYGFTEMVNNVIDHSAGSNLVVSIERTARSIVINVLDDGVGIFKKIADECHLEDQRHAIFELSKGKLTTDRRRHTGEGIFFTSRACDVFSLTSHDLSLVCLRGKDWLIESEDQGTRAGTLVRMTIRTDTRKKMDQVFQKYAVDEEPTFSRTIVPVSLAMIGDENLISRSQAKRLLARVDRFAEVVLDFGGVSEIGQAFADEVFRVFARQHPDVKLVPVRANAAVLRMVARATAAFSEEA